MPPSGLPLAAGAVVIPAGKRDRAAGEEELDALAGLATADDREALGLRDGGEQLVVLAEAEVVDGGAARERNQVEVDDHAATRARGDVSRVPGDAVGDVDHRARDAGEAKALLDADRRADVAAALPEGRARAAERAGDDESVARPGARAARHALRAAERGDREHEPLGAGRVAADDGHPRLGDPLVELEHVVDVSPLRRGERDAQRLGPGARRGEVRDVDRGGAEAEVPRGDPVEAEVHALNERVLRGDEPAAERGRVVADADREPALLEQAEQPELADLGEPHASPIRALESSSSGLRP